MKKLFQWQGLRGLVIAAYGVGNVPDRPEFIQAIKTAQEKGIKVAVITQCGQGSVALGRYQVSAGLLECGVISCLDMTTEAAQTKMAILLQGDQQAAVEDLMSVNLRGELSESLYNLRYSHGKSTAGDGTDLVATSFIIHGW